MAHLSNIEGLEMEGKLPEVRLATTPFRVVAPYEPSGDQPQAIDKLAHGVDEGLRYQTLLGVTGSGKTFTMAKTIEAVQKPTLVMAPNKTLAAQLASELKRVLPGQLGGVLRSATTTTISPKPTSRRPTRSSRRTPPSTRKWRSCAMRPRSALLVAARLHRGGVGELHLRHRQPHGLRRHGRVRGQAEADGPRRRHPRARSTSSTTATTTSFKRGTFRVRGDALDVFPPYAEQPGAHRASGATRSRASPRSTTSPARWSNEFEALPIWPASHYVATRPKMDRALATIQRRAATTACSGSRRRASCWKRSAWSMRTNYDLEMMETMGFCSGIENYSRHIDGRAPGEPPYTLIDYFPEDFLCIIDESHVTVPQIRGMHEGDRSRKITLAEHGFRLPSGLDNRPLQLRRVRSSASRSSCTCRPRQATTS